jgi:hypothetical protein
MKIGSFKSLVSIHLKNECSVTSEAEVFFFDRKVTTVDDYFFAAVHIGLEKMCGRE